MKFFSCLICIFLCSCSNVGGTKAEPLYVVNFGKNDKTYYHLMFELNQTNIVDIDHFTEQQFQQNGGQFELRISKGDFPISAPKCNSEIILRMPWVPSGYDLTKKFQLYQKILAVSNTNEEAVVVAIELNPYVAQDANGIFLTNCNVFFRQANHQYIEHIDALNKP